MPFRHARHEAAALSLHQCRLKSTLEQNSGKRGSAKRPSHNLREQVQDVSLTTARGALLEISSPELADTLQISPRTTGSNNSRHQCSLGSSNPVRRIKMCKPGLRTNLNLTEPSSKLKYNFLRSRTSPFLWQCGHLPIK